MTAKPPHSRARSRLAALTALAPLFLGCSEDGDQAPPAAAAKPSIILVSIDTLRADHVGLYGYHRDTTPFLDRWSKDATVFERAFTTATWTLVAHMTMFTGLFPEQHDVIGKRRALSPRIPLLAERLQKAGYRTISLHSPGWIEARHGFHRGFDVFRPHVGLDEAERHLHEVLDGGLDARQPFFLFLHLFDVHCGPFPSGNSIYPAPPAYEHRFVGPDAAPLPDVPAEELWEWEVRLDERQLATMIATYDGGIREVDDRLASWFAELERRGLVQGALTIVTSDHGEALGQRGHINGHGQYWQEGLHVPLIVRHPAGLLAGQRVSQPVHLGDLVPTILAFCDLPADGLPPGARLPGMSLFAPLPEQRVIYGTRLPEAFVMRWPEKLVLGPKDWCLALDLERDPRELAPAPGRPERFRELRAEAIGEASFPRALRIEKLSSADEDELRKLGYAGDEGDEGDQGNEDETDGGEGAGSRESAPR